MRQHVHRLPFGCALVLREEPDFGRIEAHQLRGDQLVGLAAHGAVARFDDDIVKSVIDAGFRRARPQQRRPVAQVAGAGEDQPQQHGHGQSG